MKMMIFRRPPAVAENNIKLCSTCYPQSRSRSPRRDPSLDRDPWRHVQWPASSARILIHEPHPPSRSCFMSWVPSRDHSPWAVSSSQITVNEPCPPFQQVHTPRPQPTLCLVTCVSSQDCVPWSVSSAKTMMAQELCRHPRPCPVTCVRSQAWVRSYITRMRTGSPPDRVGKGWEQDIKVTPAFVSRDLQPASGLAHNGWWRSQQVSRRHGEEEQTVVHSPPYWRLLWENRPNTCLYSSTPVRHFQVDATKHECVAIMIFKYSSCQQVLTKAF